MWKRTLTKSQISFLFFFLFLKSLLIPLCIKPSLFTYTLSFITLKNPDADQEKPKQAAIKKGKELNRFSLQVKHDSSVLSSSFH